VNPLFEQMKDLLLKTGSAHGVYEEAELHGVYDQDWHLWYAGWALQHGLNDLLQARFDVDTLARLLLEINEAHRQFSHGESWEEFTARWLVEKYQGQ